MSLGDIGPRIGPTKTQEAMQEVKELKAQIKQQNSSGQIQEDWRDNVNTHVKKPRKQKTLKERSGRIRQGQFSKEKGDRLLPIEKLKDEAEKFSRQNPELKSRVLVLLRQYIKPGDKAEDILKKLQEFYEDVSLQDEALDYLLETTEGELHQQVQKAKENLNQQFAREIKAGRNMGAFAREASSETTGTPSSLRDLYRDITGDPKDSTTLFNQLSKQYAYKDLQKVISFLLHSVGADLKSKGPSIPRGLLHNLLQETRSLQAILGVYTFFRGRMGLVRSMFQKNSLDLPEQLTFEAIAKQFMTLVSDRYPTGDKVLQSGVRLGIDKWILAKIIVFSQLRDAIREVAMNQVFRSLQHRDDLLGAIINALEALEEELEELLEEQGDDEEEDDEEEDEEDFLEDEDF